MRTAYMPHFPQLSRISPFLVACLHLLPACSTGPNGPAAGDAASSAEGGISGCDPSGPRDECGSPLVCGRAVDGSNQCVRADSKASLDPCNVDKECQSRSCNASTHKCRGTLSQPCEVATGCAPPDGADAANSVTLACGRYCAGMVRSACRGDAECPGQACPTDTVCGL